MQAFAVCASPPTASCAPHNTHHSTMQHHHLRTTAPAPCTRRQRMSPLALVAPLPIDARWCCQATTPCSSSSSTTHTWRAPQRAARHHVRRSAATGGAPQPPTPQQQQRQPMLKQAKNAKALAYLGDAIWALCVRTHFFVPPKHWRSYQAAVQPHVTAEGQAAAYDALLSGQAGASSEEAVFLRAVAADAARWRLRRRFSAAAAAAEVYGKATALEALVGYLHLHNPERLQVLVQALLPPAAAMPGSVSSSGESSSSSSSSSSVAEQTGPLDDDDDDDAPSSAEPAEPGSS